MSGSKSVKLRAIVAAVALFAVMLGVGLAAVTSSGYRSVCSLSNLHTREKVIVGGKIVPIGTQGVVVHIGNAVFKSTGVSYSPTYAVVKRVRGSFGSLDNDDSYALFVIGDPDCKGNVVVALYSAKTFTARYGMHAVMEENVVVEGYYDPNLTAVIVTPDGHEIEGHVLVVTKILKGCHEAYSQGTAVAQ